MKAIDPDQFRQALGAFATGVTVVTAHSPDDRDAGVTANSFNSVSLDPPLILWSIRSDSASLPAFTESKGFIVHILTQDQQALSNRFASRTDDKFAGLTFERGFGDAPLLADCAAVFQCRLVFRYDGGDHEILVGEVVDFQHSERSPLLYHGGRYGAVAPPPDTGSGDYRDRDLMHLISRVYHQLFAAEREQIARQGLSEDSYLVLRLLGEWERQTGDELAHVARTAGSQVTHKVLAELEGRDEITQLEDGSFELTEKGRQVTMELAAVRLATEHGALGSFDRSEVQALKSLLLRVSKSAAIC